MHSWDKSTRQRKNPANQSFSSSLLDEIYRELDGGVDERRMEIIKQNKERNVKKLSGSGGFGGRGKGRSSVENEEMSSLKRACLLEKWMEQKVNEKALARGRGSLVHDNDPLFFSSSSCSSDSSFGGFSSSETESFGVAKIRRAPIPKPIRTDTRIAGNSVAQDERQSEFYLFDDYRNHQTNKTNEDSGRLVKSKARAQKIYANLKKIKQPISPGGRLTSFINSIFANGNPKKSRESHRNAGNSSEVNGDWKSRSAQTSTCSSASSFSRSCLSKNSPNSKQKRNNGVKRSVRFYPVSVIVDEDCRPCGHKCLYEEEVEKFKNPILRNQTNLKQPMPPIVDHRSNDVSRNYEKSKKIDFAATINQEDYDFEDDCASDLSSDLFELDHLASFKDDRFCEDLPVYETTHLGLNRAIANGLIR
ncbi:hypothetical protein ACET3Z_003470 [Daucus carota]